MKLYTNVIPFCSEWGQDNKPKFIEVGTTFAAVGADFNGIMLERVSDINSGILKDSSMPCSINPTVFNIVFKEVEHLRT